MDVDDGPRTPNPLEKEEERRNFRRIECAFKYYKKHSLARISKTEAFMSSLPERHQEMLEKYKQHLGTIRQCIEKNEKIINLIIRDVNWMFVNIHPDNADDLDSNINHSSNVSNDLERVQTTLKQLVRDWSSEGAKERMMCYQPIIDELLRTFPQNLCDPANIKVLVPGAGLGRLAFEIARNGYECQGNEFSLFMLFASNFVLNRIHEVNAYELFPWVHQNCNILKGESQTRSVLFPDVNPSDLPSSTFSMTAGDFLEVYVEPEQWDCVATCFFIDCAHNIVSFIETIYNILKPGGVWLNLGPLLYHFADNANENSIEPSYEVVRDIIEKVGFQIEKEDTNVSTTYSQMQESMLQQEYKSVFFRCRKPAFQQNGHAHPEKNSAGQKRSIQDT
ncbi:carnosine N-methyltransferase [Thrips palmi]|uniref:Carnosine N-methyltransferase n=1 Tax=Thrips palmi TaxID=161013 RepID=A0A6P8ZN70_THRPL|nr:carnosine N-methyltransferase [Thrips palmi]